MLVRWVLPVDLGKGNPRLTFLVFPVALFAFGYPFDGLGDALVAGFRALGVGYPISVFALSAGAEGGEDFCGGLAGFEGLGKGIGDFGLNLGGFHYPVAGSDGAGVVAAVNEGNGLPEPGDHLLV